LKNKKVAKKDIGSQLKKSQAWVTKVFKMKSSQIKKPSGSVVKQIEMLQTQMIRNQQSTEDYEGKMMQARQKLHKLYAE